MAGFVWDGFPERRVMFCEGFSQDRETLSRDITGLYRCVINAVHRNYAENLQTERI